MFILSKIFWLLAQPLSLAFASVVIALVLAVFRFRRSGIAFSAFAVAILFATLYTSGGSMLLQRLEDRFARPAADPAALSCMIVLGGSFETQVTTVRGGTELNDGAERFTEALRLALKYPQARILVSGGDGSFSGAYEGDAAAAARFFEAYGVGADRLVREDASRNTFENAVNTADVLQERRLENCLLITSAFHMPRSVGLFRRAGIPVVPWPVDYRTTGTETLRLDFTQPTRNAQLTAGGLRETIGLVAYYMMGRTDAVFPAP